MGNYKKVNSLDNSRRCRQILLYLLNSAILVLILTKSIYIEIQNMVVDLHNKYRHFTTITFCTNFVLDAGISVRPANAIEC